MKKIYHSLLLPSKCMKGFSLVELMITLVISLVVAAASYSSYTVYQRHYTNQLQVVEMQDNVRAAMNFMSDEIRLAGYNPKGFSSAGIVSATATSFNFTKDVTNAGGTSADGDGLLNGPYENLTFGFPAGADVLPVPDGIADSGAAPLSMIVGGVALPQSIAEHISAIEFSYTLDGSPPPPPTLTPSPTKDIRLVTISILGRMKNSSPGYTDTATYTTGSGASWGPFNDNYRRRLLIATVKCRNMGL